MGEILKFGKAMAITSMVRGWAFAITLVLSSLAFAFGDGGTLTISWVPE
ncbi:MAG: hypothetical protein ACRBBW_21305 [Cellvibrionaceae bacterium]